MIYASVDAYEPLQKVRIDGEIEATIVAVKITPGFVVNYVCEWWNGRTIQSGQFEAERVKADDPQMCRIGFHKDKR